MCMCFFYSLSLSEYVSLVFTFWWETFLLNMMFKCCQVGNVAIIHHVPRQGFFIIKILCHIGYMYVYVSAAVPYVEGGWVCFLSYTFRVSIIFSRLLINCNADHNNSIHKFGWEYASRFFYTSLRLTAPNDKWILFSDAKQIGSQSGKCGNSVCCWHFFPFFRRVSMLY